MIRQILADSSVQEKPWVNTARATSWISRKTTIPTIRTMESTSKTFSSTPVIVFIAFIADTPLLKNTLTAP